VATRNHSRGTRPIGRSGGNRPRTHPTPYPKRRPPPKPGGLTAGDALRRTQRIRENRLAGRRRRKLQPPDLTAILDSFSDAAALVSVAAKVVASSSYSGPESSVLRLGVEALNKVYDQLDAADTALHHFLKKHAVAKGGGA